MSGPDLENGVSDADLESRYRRLLVWYPWSHRRVYEEEMLAVLVAGARPGQRRPTIGEAANLVVSGLRVRAGAAVTGLAGPAWTDAAAVFGLLAAVVLLSQRVVRLFELVGPGLSTIAYLRAAGWCVVVLAILAGLRRSAAALAWTTVLGEAVLVARQYGSDPVSAVHLFWPLALGVAAAAALTVPAPRRRAVAVLKAHRLLAFVLGVSLVQAIVVVNALHRYAAWSQDAGGTFFTFDGLENKSEGVLVLWLAAIALGALAAGLAVLTLPAAVRWRIAVLAAPVGALAAMVKLILEGWAYSNFRMGHPIYLVPVQWTLLVVVPLAVLGLGAVLVQWREQFARMAALGRAADRERLLIAPEAE